MPDQKNYSFSLNFQRLNGCVCPVLHLAISPKGSSAKVGPPNGGGIRGSRQYLAAAEIPVSWMIEKAKAYQSDSSIIFGYQKKSSGLPSKHPSHVLAMFPDRGLEDHHQGLAEPRLELAMARIAYCNHQLHGHRQCRKRICFKGSHSHLQQVLSQVLQSSIKHHFSSTVYIPIFSISFMDIPSGEAQMTFRTSRSHVLWRMPSASFLECFRVSRISRTIRGRMMKNDEDWMEI